MAKKKPTAQAPEESPQPFSWPEGFDTWTEEQVDAYRRQLDLERDAHVDTEEEKAAIAQLVQIAQEQHRASFEKVGQEMPATRPGVRIIRIDLPIDGAAPLGSAPWSRAVHLRMLDMLKDAKTGLQRFSSAVRVFQEHKGWQQLDDQYGHPFPSFRAFCTAKAPRGLGYDPQVIDTLVQETREITLGEKMAEIQALREHGTNQHSNTGVDVVNSTSVQGGNSRDYLLARLKRDSPEIAEALARGEYPSVRAAAKAAGLISDPTPLTLLQRAWTKASPEDHQGFFRWLLERADQYMAERRTPDEPQAPLEALWDETIDVDYDDALVTQLLKVYDAAHAWWHDRNAAMEKGASRVEETPDGKVVYEYPVRKNGEILDALWANEGAFIAKLAALSVVIDGYFSRADDSTEGPP